MGARGPKPAPSNVRSLTGDTRPSRAVNEMAAPSGEPEFPAWLEDKDAPLETHREVWERVSRYLRSLRIQSDVDTDMVRVYVQSVVMMDRIGKVLATAPAIVRDANGMPSANPLLKEWRAAAQQVRTAGAMFGMAGPSSRVFSSADQAIGSQSRADDLAG